MKKLDTKPQNTIQKRPKTAATILKDQPSLFTISPDYVLIISLFFIATVFLLHIVAKYSTANYGLQVAMAIIVLVVSIGYAVVS
ncbi:hypothetical protein COBT_001156, partial [Conglomerata obtusa]